MQNYHYGLRGGELLCSNNEFLSEANQLINYFEMFLPRGDGVLSFSL